MEYAFVFCGGSCGSFVKTIWYYYLNKLNKWPHTILLEHGPLGDCHIEKNIIPKHYHYVGDITNIRAQKSQTKIILIEFDDDDLASITLMQYVKHANKWLADHKEEAS